MLVSSAEWSAKLQSNEQLKTLCTVILTKTITDTDKYQAGLTKIFFRAGMLASLESMRSTRLNGLVTIVQKNVRRRLAVKRYGQMRSGAIKIQTWWRGIMARRLVGHLRKEACALRLQKAGRAFVQRKKFLDCRRGVILVQSRECNSYYLSLHNLPFSTGIRGIQARAGFREARTVGAVTLLQSLLRGVYAFLLGFLSLQRSPDLFAASYGGSTVPTLGT
jgi:myosin-5